MSRLFDISCEPPWLVARFERRQRVLSWSLNRPGFAEADAVAWLQVTNADLPIGVDPVDFFDRRLAERNLGDAVGLMTARDIRNHHVAHAASDGIEVDALVTLGLSNGIALDRSGRAIDERERAPSGTINLLVAVSVAMSEAALVEAMSVATTARTAALLANAGSFVGTGTDCIAVACPTGGNGERFAGLHTNVGRQIAACVFTSTAEARALWERQRAASMNG